MKLICCLFATLLMWGVAQEGAAPVISEDTVGILSYIDADITVSADCVGEDLIACMPHIEVIDLSQYEACQESEGEVCAQEYAYRVPYITVQQSERIEEELQKHWDWYWWEVIHVYNDHIWTLPLCINFAAICPDPGINWGCLTERLQEAYTEVLTEVQPKYWKKVYQTVVTYEPFALWYHTPYPPVPNGGAILSPVSSLEPKLTQLYGLIEKDEGAADTARRGAYYLQDPIPGIGAVDLPIPYMQDEIDQLSGGIQTYEVDKVGLEPATLLEQQHFGFGNLFNLWNEVTLVIHFAVLAGPYAPGWCSSLIPPYFGPTITPIPAVIFPTHEARVEYASVPEGYGLARVKTDPLNVRP